MFTTRFPDPSFIEEYKLDIGSYSEEQQKEHLKKNIEQAAFWYQVGIPTKLHGSPHLEFRAFASIHQNWALLRQNELILRQNERIIQLLEKLADEPPTFTQGTCPQCSAVCSNTAFCSQCGHKLAD